MRFNIRPFPSRYKMFLLSLLCLFPAYDSQVLATEVPIESTAPYEPHHNVHQYLLAKYQDITVANWYVNQTLYGPYGQLFVTGNMVPVTTLDKNDLFNKQDRARMIAKSFMNSEPELFGIVDVNEMVQYHELESTGVNGDYTIIYYNRHINGVELQNSEINIEVGQDENIKNFSARLVPVPAETYRATKEKVLSEQEVRLIVEADLLQDIKSDYAKARKAETDSGGNEKIQLRRTSKKIALITPPYVIWKVQLYTTDYTINAFTGAILTKVSTIRPRPYPNQKPKSIAGLRGKS